jgi:hypothetical protein
VVQMGPLDQYEKEEDEEKPVVDVEETVSP